MKVKIGNKVYSAEDVAICVMLTDEDKNNIANMFKENSHYAVFPDSDTRSYAEMLAWMDLK